MLYDIPGRTGVRITTGVLQRLAEHPRIIAVKDATGDLVAGMTVMATTDLAYYCGDDALNLPWLAIGAAGLVSVTGHVTGRLHAELVAAVDAGDLPAARAVNARLIGVVNAIMSPESQGAIRAKAALQIAGILPQRTTRLPLLPAAEADLGPLQSALAAAGLLVAAP